MHEYIGVYKTKEYFFSNSKTVATIKGKNKNKKTQYASISQLARNIVYYIGSKKEIKG